MSYKYETNIPPPTPVEKSVPDGAIIDVIRDMQVGQSHFFPGGNRPSISTACLRVKKEHRSDGERPPCYTTRKRIEDGVFGVRVWRIR